MVLKKRLWLISLTAFLLISACSTENDNLRIFPLQRYNQSVSTWIKPSDAHYDQRLLTSQFQQARLNEFYHHEYGSLSPWNLEFVSQILNHAAPDDLKTNEKLVIAQFDNRYQSGDSIGYGENYIPYSSNWIDEIIENIHLSQFDQLRVQSRQRAITVANLYARALPTDDVYFYSHKIAGEGYPFDNLQESAIWAGTPVYLLGQTRDQAWSLVMTPEYIVWVHSDGIARVSDHFIQTWQTLAKNHLAAITKTKTSIIDNNNKFLFSAYIGSVFPAKKISSQLQLVVPVADLNQNAIIKYATVPSENAVMMPLSMTPHQFANIMSSLIGRPYGWGNMYFYNDCSAELKSLFTPFGLWIPRSSRDQFTAGKMIDLSAASKTERLSYLQQQGHPFLTIIHLAGHVVLYIGNYPNPNSQNHDAMVMVYENAWGLVPYAQDSRAVIGKAVLFPLLLQYPEDPQLRSSLENQFFQLIYLDEMPVYSGAPTLRRLMPGS